MKTLTLHKDSITPELIAACKIGDRKSQEIVYKTYASKMYAVCMRYATDTMEAEDILMVGFTRVFTKIETYSGHGSFEGWIRSIIVNAALSNYYKNLRRIKTTSYDSVPYMKEIAVGEQKSDLDYLLKALQILPKQYKQAFNMFVLEGYTHREIGKLLDISESLSKVHVSRARKILQDNLKKVAVRIDRTCFAA
jgi:RNA polymerase sigma factor (sigma-70 family)